MNIVERAVAFLAPHNCLVCEREGGLLCAWCRPDACPGLPERCYRCQKLSPASRVCENCRRLSKLSYVWTVTEYKGIAKEILHKFKFERARSGANLIASYLNDRLPQLNTATIVTNIPTSTARVRVRGYDQAQLIAKQFAAKRGLLSARLLARFGQQRQVGADRKTRQEQLANSFIPLRNSLIDQTQILVIDDVLTTGATLEAAAAVLKAAGARSVDGAVFAQSL